MNNHTSSAQASAPKSLHQYAEASLRYIRNRMGSSTSRTNVSGKGHVLAGISSVAATGPAALQPGTTAWLMAWMAEFALGTTITFAWTTSKANATLGEGILHSAYGINVWRNYGGE